MAAWFTTLMQKGHARSQCAAAAGGFSKQQDAGPSLDARDARYDAIVQMLRDREVDDRNAREKRQRWYKQYLKIDSGAGGTVSSPSSATRLYRMPTKVPCRLTPEARPLLEQLRKRFSGGSVSIVQINGHQQAVMLTRTPGAEPKQIGWVEHCVHTDPKRCNVRDQGLFVETDGGTMLVLRFRYPATAVRMTRHQAEERPLRRVSRSQECASVRHRSDEHELPCEIEDMTSVDFTELRPALELQPRDKTSPPRLVWITRPEAETMNALRSRDYEAFYVRFKLEILGGIWRSLTGVLSSAPCSQWHRGSYYTVMREADAAKGRIYQRTTDDSGRAVDIGSNRIFDAALATDILLLYLEGDILADFADIYFTLQSLGSTEAYFLKEEFFRVIRRFWASSRSLASRYGSDVAAVVRMSQRAAPMPAQASLLKQDWTTLRQSLVDRYGVGGRNAADVRPQNVYPPRTGPAGWPFASFPGGEINLGLRLIYRQEWRHLGAQRGEIVRTIPRPPRHEEQADAAVAKMQAERVDGDTRRVETIIEQGDATRRLDETVDEAFRSAVDAMKWPLDFEQSINTGVRGLAAKTDMGLESECRESSRETSARLSDIMQRLVGKTHDDTVAARGNRDEALELPCAPDVEGRLEQHSDARVYSRLQHRYEVLTQSAAIENVVLVAEPLPTPAEIDLSWVRRHDRILSKVLLDESFRHALDTIELKLRPRDRKLEAKRARLYAHLRANILHYQRAIWQQEDPQQRSMRYRKSGKKVPLEWQFELELGGSLTIDELCDRLAAPSIDGQFATYSTGRQADLDLVIDPAGPIGYYGNFAVYRMRAEFGSKDLFSLLHFFKSPYLRTNPATGEAEVEDPVQSQITNDLAISPPSDRVIAEHRDQMLEYVPELRLELAQVPKNVSAATDPSATEKVERESATLRRHFPTYLFRRERARRIALDSDGLVIDVLRAVDATASTGESGDCAIQPAEVPTGHELILQGGVELLTPNRHRNANAEWTLLADDGNRQHLLVAGNAGAAVDRRDAQAHAIALARQSDTRALARRAGANHATSNSSILSQADDGVRLSSSAGTGAAHVNEPSSVPRDVAAATANMLSGKEIRPDPGDEHVIATRGATSTVRAGRLQDPHSESIVVTPGMDTRVRALRTGRVRHPDDAEPMVLASDDQALRFNLVAGHEERQPHEWRGIVAKDEGLRINPAGAPAVHDQAILSTGNEHPARLRVGTAHRQPDEEGIRAGLEGGLTLTTRGGEVAAHPHERVIVSRDDEWLRPSPIAG